MTVPCQTPIGVVGSNHGASAALTGQELERAAVFRSAGFSPQERSVGTLLRTKVRAPAGGRFLESSRGGSVALIESEPAGRMEGSLKAIPTPLGLGRGTDPRRAQAPAVRIVSIAGLILLLWSCLGIALDASACRFSVRDTGFVDLGAAPYELTLYPGEALSPEVVRRYEQTAAAVFLDANIRWGSASAGSPSVGVNPEARLELRSSDGRVLTVASGAELSVEGTAIVDLLEQVALSPVRARLQDEMLRAYAVILLVEGRDSRANQRVRDLLDQAAAAIGRLLPQMPKPVDVPPQVVTLAVGSVAAEKVLVWGLGMEPKATEDPRVAIVFGRGRRIGEALEGPLVTRTQVQDRLALIGQDCECDLDRSWLQGPLFPARWDDARQRAAAAALDFDPENPLIRTEISRIVLRGADFPGPGRSAVGSFDALSLGYSEEPVEVIEVAASRAAEAGGTAEAVPVPAAVGEGSPAVAVTGAGVAKGGVGRAGQDSGDASAASGSWLRLTWAAVLLLALGVGGVGVALFILSRKDRS